MTQRLPGNPNFGRRWTEEEKRELLRMRRAKVPTEEICRKLDRSLKSVMNMACKLSAPLAKPPYRTSDVRQIERMAQSGYSDRVIAMTVGRPLDGLQKFRRRRGIAAGLKRGTA